MRERIVLIGSLLTWVLAVATPAAGQVTVQVEPAKIVRRTFDPKHPPSDMPRLTRREVGLCAYSFGCATEIAARRDKKNESPWITRIHLDVRLEITMWTPEPGSPKILAHEEGHREICEIYYHSAESIGREVAARFIGTKLEGRIPDKLGADANLKTVQASMIAAYLHETESRCERAQAAFDRITRHSQNSVSNTVAIALAVAEERGHLR